MMVLDASAVLELLLNTVLGQSIAERIASTSLTLHVPHLLDVEVIHALRRFVREGEIEVSAAEVAIVDLQDLDLERHSHEPLLARAWELRDNLTCYDAVYVALAEALGAKLLTCDAKLARAPGLARFVELVS
jgi:predicted nucleic acid-binding protein